MKRPLVAILLLFCPAVLWAVQLDPIAPPLRADVVPATPGLVDGPRPIVIDRVAAIRLGKALFWDMNVGSDGVACATCHFHAGADRRIRNQLNPGSRHAALSGGRFEPLASGAAGGIDHTLRATDFPLFRLRDPGDKTSGVLFATDDVVASAGVVAASFRAPDADGRDQCAPMADPLFHLGGTNTRRTTSRNAPTVINAALNYRNFWDGRANNRFNGENPYGPRSPGAGVWELRAGKPVKTPILLENAALASQAVEPPLGAEEMSCAGRRFPDLARKLLNRHPLDHQQVHPEDSVLAESRAASGLGLKPTYADLIRAAFDRRYWAATGGFGQPTGYSHMEANFALFFGLAIQLYEATLISDQTPFDSPRGPDGFPRAFDTAQKRGLILFNKAECDFCHIGPGFSAAQHPALYTTLAPGQPPKLVERRSLSVNRATRTAFLALADVGYHNTSTTPDDFDPGLGGHDPWGHPLSFARQYLATLLDPHQAMVDPVAITAFDFSLNFQRAFDPGELTAPPAPGRFALGDPAQALVPKPEIAQAEWAKPDHGRLAIAVAGAFKVPTLRNVELTGPYMHNGSMKSLDEVIEFYDRGGNVENPAHFGAFVFRQRFSAEDKRDLLAFLLALTDERVRWERAPFDHPELRVPHGAMADWLSIPAVGRAGRDAALGPLRPFADYLAP